MSQSKLQQSTPKGNKNRGLQGRHRSKSASCLHYLSYGIVGLILLLSVTIIVVSTGNMSPETKMNTLEDSADHLPHLVISSVNNKTKTEHGNVNFIPNNGDDTIPVPTSDEGTLEKPLIVHALDFNGKVERHISLIPGGKTGLRQNLRVIMNNGNNGAETRPGSDKDKETRAERKRRQIEEDGDGGAVVGMPWAYLEAQKILKSHPLFQAGDPGDLRKGEKVENDSNNKMIQMIPSLEDTMLYMSQHPACLKTPIFLTMATVGDDLYWQLIENFVYSMVKFEISNCSLVICVSDPKCMRLCNENDFPCYDYQTERKPLPSVMEQIGEVKLFHIPQAMSKGVDVFMLDLDVGFLSDPRGIVRTFYETPDVDIFVQVCSFKFDLCLAVPLFH